jgi:hypothetical protein
VTAFWTAPVRPEPLAAFRIFAGVSITLSVLLGIATDVGLMFSERGLIPGETAEGVLARTGRFSLKHGVLDTTLGSSILLALLLSALVCVTVGYRTRIAAAVGYVLLVSFTQRSLTLTNGGDDLAVHALFYLVLAPAGAIWSLDAKRCGTKKQVAPWALRLMQIQLCLIYFSTALSKINVAGPRDWLTGEAVYWALNDITLTRWSYALVPVPLIVCRLMTWGTLAFEFSLPLLVWVPRLRRPLLLAGLGLHLGILLTMQVGFFSPNILVFYLLFVPPEALVRLRERLALWATWRSPRAPREEPRVLPDSVA